MPSLPSIPVQPILRRGNKPWVLFESIARYPWVLSVYHYNEKSELLRNLRERVIDPAEIKAIELQRESEWVTASLARARNKRI